MPTLAGMRLRKAFGLIVVALVALVAGAFLFAWSGVYTVAASRGHWAIVEWFLEFGMKNSVKRRAWAIRTPPLDDPDLQTLGAAHFHRACAHCHGAPGMAGDLTAQRSLPPPPDLTHVSAEWKDNELFWIVKNGIKYTGMPSWVALERDDEVWAVVAFLKTLPGLDRQSYRRLALGGFSTADLVGACSPCHGAEQHGPASGLVPVLHGQPREFLTAALSAYAAGRRQSGIMQPITAELTADMVEKLAEYYSSLPVPKRRSDPTISALATRGDAAARIPACIGCHDSKALRIYPRLAGQNAPYMANRLRSWKSGRKPSTDTEAVMAPIARLLSEAQVIEISAYFSTRRPDHEADEPL